MPLADNYDRLHNCSAGERALFDRYALLPADPLRQRAFEAFMRTGLPHRRMDAWKWTDFKTALAAPVPKATKNLSSPLPATSNTLVLRLSPEGPELPPGDLPSGLALRVREKMAAPMIAILNDMPLVALTMALNTQADQCGNDLILEVTEPISEPLHITFTANKEVINLARLTITLAPGASLNLVENHLGGTHFSSFVVEIEAGANASLTRTVLQQGGSHEVQAITALARLGHSSRYTQTILAFGARLARIETHLTHQETASQATINTAYLCGRGHHADITSHIHHNAPACMTRQTTKGGVLKGGTGVFQGTFHVPPVIGQHTDAGMEHHALMLEEGAGIFARPELEIHADDVECSHSNTSGTLDANQLFYLRQRGIPLLTARAMLTEGFIRDALDSAFDPVRPALNKSVCAFLEAGV